MVTTVSFLFFLFLFLFILSHTRLLVLTVNPPRMFPYWSRSSKLSKNLSFNKPAFWCSSSRLIDLFVHSQTLTRSYSSILPLMMCLADCRGKMIAMYNTFYCITLQYSKI
jgi:hypothetical protein